ncbi:MAG: hypothetical protein ACREIC_17745, partial [Limisphaerales bacterium]
MLIQGENPSQLSRQTLDTVRVRTYTLPEAKAAVPSRAFAAVPNDSGGSQVSSAAMETPAPRSLTPGSVQVTEREETHATTELGAAQRDTGRDLAAKLASLKSVTWMGVVVFLFGLASLFWPPLKALIGSVTTSVAVSVGGLLLVVLPTLIAGNELLILAVVLGVVAAWFLAHRHGQLRGALNAQPPATTPTSAPA